MKWGRNKTACNKTLLLLFMKKLATILTMIVMFSCNRGDQMTEFYRLADDQKHKGNFDSALYYVDKALDIDENFYPGQFERLRLLWHLGRNEEALVTAKKISKLRKSVNVSMEGLAYEKLGDTLKAKELYRKTLDNWARVDLDTNFQSRLEYAQLTAVVYDKDAGLKELNKIDTTNLNWGEIEIINYLKTSILTYNKNGYAGLLENMERVGREMTQSEK
jgi:tetratricopeptide (TPR) repeat protein